MKTHLAGNAISIGQYIIQRCLLCGEKLLEVNTSRVLACSSNNNNKLLTLQVGGFYEVEGNRTSLIASTDTSYFDSDLDLPENCCIRQQ